MKLMIRKTKQKHLSIACVMKKKRPAIFILKDLSFLLLINILEYAILKVHCMSDFVKGKFLNGV